MKIPACYALCMMYSAARAARQLLGIWCIDVGLVVLLTIF